MLENVNWAELGNGSMLPVRVCDNEDCNCYWKRRHGTFWEQQTQEGLGWCHAKWQKVLNIPNIENKEGWLPKSWCFWIVVLEKTLENPLDWKEIKPVNAKGNQSWIFTGRTDAEAEASILWPPDAKSQLTGKDPDAGKDWRQEVKGTTEDEMVGWHHRLDGQEFYQIVGDSGGQKSLGYCSSWGRKELDTT